MVKIADIGELMTAVEAIPLFPLPGTVFIPHTMLPLHVFEARYRALVFDPGVLHRGGHCRQIDKL